MRRVIVMLGFPASGKGTQAEILAKKISARIIGVGDLVRAEIENSKNAKRIVQIKENYDRGIPQKDVIIESLVEEAVKKSSGSLIFDNFPYSESQIKFFQQLLVKYNLPVPIVIYIKISKESAVKRISKRKICDTCDEIYLSGNIGDHCKKCAGRLIQRDDDKPEVVRERIEHARPRIEMVVNHFRKQNWLVYEINGEPFIDKVTKEINQKLNAR